MTDMLLAFLDEHAATDGERPFFAYLALLAPHFPLQARPDDVAKYRGRYDAGQDAVRQTRYERILKLGLTHGPLPPAEPDIVAPSGNEDQRRRLGAGEAARALPWESLSDEQRAFQARKMELHAAMVDRVDQEVGRVVAWLEQHGELDDTVLFVLSDNGASAEILVRGDGHDATAEPGSAASFLCLGPGWSTVANTPMRRHKIWTHEGGVATPLVVHWPRGIAARGELRRTPGHVVDLVPTLLALAGCDAEPAVGAPPWPGRSLVGAFAADEAIEREPIFFLHAGNRALRDGDWKIVSARGEPWALYDLAHDRGETSDRAADEPERLAAMVTRWAAIERTHDEQLRRR
jgi:arylsulfatase